jgi:hypothetical protein
VTSMLFVPEPVLTVRLLGRVEKGTWMGRHPEAFKDRLRVYTQLIQLRARRRTAPLRGAQARL